jgi:hypothetical protein
MICIGESDYFRYNNPEEENCISETDRNNNAIAFTSSFIEKNSINNNTNVNSNNYVSKSLTNNSNFV